MPFNKTAIPEVIVFEPEIIKDSRGYFYESYRENVFFEAGIKSKFVQDNVSKSSYGILRGLHYQHPPYTQGKLVRVLIGKVMDVAVDLRKGSPTFGKWVGEELSSDNRRQLYIPRGFAHGFAVLSETAEFTYKCDNYYKKDAEGGVNFGDPMIGIEWGLPFSGITVSEKDGMLPFLDGADIRFKYGAEI